MRRRFWILAAFGLVLAGPARAADDPQAIIDTAIQAAGGREIMAKSLTNTWKVKGTVHVNGLDIPYTSEDAFQAPDRFRSTVEGDVMGNKFVAIVVNKGDKAWRSVGGQSMELTGNELTEMRERVYFQWVSRLVPLIDKAFMLSSAGEIQVEGKPAVGVKISHKGHADVTLFFDKATGLLVKGQQRVKNAMTGQEQDQELFFSSYKDTPGGKHAMKVIVKRDGQPFVENEVIDLQSLAKLDDQLFEEPK